jgi:competence protein ComFB
MNNFYNIMETIVIKKLEEVWDTSDCCKCEQCRNDIIAYALNQLPPKYVASSEGELYSRASELSAEQEFDILLAVARAMQIVTDNPRHDKMISPTKTHL